MTKPTDPSAIADWAESKALVAAPRKPAGAAGRVTPDERREIQLVHLTEGLNISQLAAKYGRTRETIASCLKGDDFEKVREQALAELATLAKNRLAGGVSKAADGWVTSIDIAAASGNHKPAKELLEAVGVIEDRSAPRMNVNIVVGMPGSPAGPDPLVGIDVAAVGDGQA